MTTNTTTTTETTTKGAGKLRQPPTAIEAIAKITKILGQLSTGDRKRVLAFINIDESAE